MTREENWWSSSAWRWQGSCLYTARISSHTPHSWVVFLYMWKEKSCVLQTFGGEFKAGWAIAGRDVCFCLHSINCREECNELSLLPRQKLTIAKQAALFFFYISCFLLYERHRLLAVCEGFPIKCVYVLLCLFFCQGICIRLEMTFHRGSQSTPK